MRRLGVAIAVIVGFSALAACGGGKGGNTPSAQSGALPTRTVEAGAVTVKIEPLRLDAGGADFKVTFDTHAVALDLDVARSATLTVAGKSWVGATWSGDGPGGHHRAGTLHFTAAEPVTGSAVLSLVGLPGPVEANWTLGG